MDESGDFSGDWGEAAVCEDIVTPSAAMIAIMVVSMLCTIASTAKTFATSRTAEPTQSYDTYGDGGTEMLDLRIRYGSD